jgi:enoyl-CoA hydratase
MTPEMLDAFQAAVSEVEKNPEVRAVVLTGAGSAFCAGADFTLMPELLARTGLTGTIAFREAIPKLYGAFLTLDRLAVPTIAAVNGAAIGGGLGIALLCDMRIVSETAKLAVNFTRLGIAPGLGITALLPKAVGYERAAEMLFTGQTILGAQAASWGLAREAVPQEKVLPRALEIAEKVAAAAPLAVRQTKRTLRALSGRNDLSAALELEALAQTVLGTTDDASEGIRAMLEKRDPEFQGR